MRTEKCPHAQGLKIKFILAPEHKQTLEYKCLYLNVHAPKKQYQTYKHTMMDTEAQIYMNVLINTQSQREKNQPTPATIPLVTFPMQLTPLLQTLFLTL